jgi:hypothetical protein
MTMQCTIPGKVLELPRWLNPAPRGSPKKVLARAVMWGGYVHLPKGFLHTTEYAHVNDLDI